MPGSYEITKKRAIVENEPIGTEYSIGQDMGSHSARISLQGIITQTDQASFLNLSVTTQISTAGKVTIDFSGDNGQSWSYVDCALTAFTFKPYPGNPIFYKYAADFTQYAGQS